MARYNIVFLFVLVLSVIYNAEAKVFDITTFGATPGGDSTQALVAAWAAGCKSHGGAVVLVPKGIFLVAQVQLAGPCTGPMVFQLEGTINAPEDSSLFKQTIDWITFGTVEGLTITGGGIIDGQGQQTWTKKIAKQIPFNQPTNLGLYFIKNGMVTGITIQNSKMFQNNLFGCTNVTYQGVTIIAPADSPNTDGIHIGRSSDIKVIDTSISTGDDCISIGDGAEQVNVSGVRCGPGHGFAVGSLGKYPGEKPVVGIFVRNSTLENTTNGLRVKTWRKSAGPGIASDIHFEDITVTNVTYPIFVDQEYCPTGDCPESDPPSLVQISKLSFRGITGTSATKSIVQLVCSKDRPCAEVEIGRIDITYNGPEKPDPVSVCQNVQPTVTDTQNPGVCTDAVLPLPAGSPLPAAIGANPAIQVNAPAVAAPIPAVAVLPTTHKSRRL